MIVFGKAKSLEDVGWEHLQTCNRIASNTRDFNAAILEAVRSLPVRDLRRASSTEESAAELLSAPMNAVLTHSSHSVVGSYLFYVSVFSAALDAGLDGPLVSTAGKFAATSLEEIMVMALQSEHHEFIRGTAGMLDRLGDLLGDAFYKVSARSFQLLVDLSKDGSSTSEGEVLAVEIEVDLLRDEVQRLLPVARQQCADDETRMSRLDQCEKLLKV